MKIFVNEIKVEVADNGTVSGIAAKHKKDAEIMILNGFAVEGDVVLKENDHLFLMEKGKFPSAAELESLMMSRHTPGVYAKVKKAKVGIAGLGGLGSNIAVSLARLGVGKLLLIDFDTVDPSNLNRQQYFIRHIGMKKTEALKELIKEINPFIEVIVRDEVIDKNNVKEFFQDMDVIVEALDRPEAKATLINTALQQLPDKPLVAASGMAGYFSNNNIVTKKIKENFYLIGDGENEAKAGSGLMAPRVAIAANHQANTVLRIIMGERDV